MQFWTRFIAVRGGGLSDDSGDWVLLLACAAGEASRTLKLIGAGEGSGGLWAIRWRSQKEVSGLVLYL